MYCRNCGVELGDNQVVCLSCGVKVGEGKAHCVHCGHAVHENAVVCVNCGAAIKKQVVKSSDLAGKDKIVIALLCFFFGHFGIHNFVLGESKKGLIKIVLTFCFGIGVIFALIDFINILTDRYVVDPTKAI